MRTGSIAGMTRRQIEAALERITEQHYRADLTNEQKLAIEDLGKTYVTFDRLRREGRDSVWAYVARNLSRPLAYSAAGGWAHVVVGNPPWVAFRHMSADLQKRFKELAQRRENLRRRQIRDAERSERTVHRARRALYLRSGGRFAFVLPMAALTRGQFARLRSGSFSSARIAWDDAWTMDDTVQPLFPVPSCVVFGRRRATVEPLPDKVRAYSGTLPYRDAPEDIADARLRCVEGAPALAAGAVRRRLGLSQIVPTRCDLVPRMLCLVERKAMGRLGVDPSAPFVVSRRNKQEKTPWKDLPGIENRVEAEFLHPVLLGESILPYRVFRPVRGCRARRRDRRGA